MSDYSCSNCDAAVGHYDTCSRAHASCQQEIERLIGERDRALIEWKHETAALDSHVAEIAALKAENAECSSNLANIEIYQDSLKAEIERMKGTLEKIVACQNEADGCAYVYRQMAQEGLMPAQKPAPDSPGQSKAEWLKQKPIEQATDKDRIRAVLPTLPQKPTEIHAAAGLPFERGREALWLLIADGSAEIVGDWKVRKVEQARCGKMIRETGAGYLYSRPCPKPPHHLEPCAPVKGSE